jgi:hypothetical protein
LVLVSVPDAPANQQGSNQGKAEFFKISRHMLSLTDFYLMWPVYAGRS